VNRAWVAMGHVIVSPVAYHDMLLIHYNRLIAGLHWRQTVQSAHNTTAPRQHSKTNLVNGPVNLFVRSAHWERKRHRRSVWPDAPRQPRGWRLWDVLWLNPGEQQGVYYSLPDCRYQLVVRQRPERQQARRIAQMVCVRARVSRPGAQAFLLGE
jgi:hypothetical protein